MLAIAKVIIRSFAGSKVDLCTIENIQSSCQCQMLQELGTGTYRMEMYKVHVDTMV
jgi:hypothetical protein